MANPVKQKVKQPDGKIKEFTVYRHNPGESAEEVQKQIAQDKEKGSSTSPKPQDKGDKPKGS